MLRTFFRDSVIYGLLRVLTSGMAILLLPLYTRVLTPSQYGVVDLVAVSSTILMILVNLDIVQGMARYASAEDAAERRAYASTAFWFTLASFGAFAIVIAASAPAVSELVSNTHLYATEMRIAAASLVAQALLYVALTDLRYALRPWAYAAASVVFSATAVGTALLYLIVFRLGVAGVFLAQLTANATGLAVALALARHDLGFVFDASRWRDMLRFSAPLVLSSLGVLAATYADRFAVRSFLSLAALGVYAVGARVASVVAVAINAFQTALSPLIYRHHADAGAPAEIERIFRWFLVATTALVTFVGAFGREIVTILADDAYAGAASVVFLLGVAAVAANLYLFAPGLWIAKRTGIIATINLTAAAAAIALNMLVVPRFGLRGAAIVACAIGFCGFAVQVGLAQRVYPMPYRLGRLAGAALLFAAFGVLVMSWSGGGELALRIAVFAATNVIMLLALVGRDEVVRAIGVLRRAGVRANHRVRESGVS